MGIGDAAPSEVIGHYRAIIKPKIINHQKAVSKARRS
jgi:hypothetical protein